ISPNVKAIPTWETAPPVTSLITIAPVPANTRAKVPNVSAASFRIVSPSATCHCEQMIYNRCSANVFTLPPRPPLAKGGSILEFGVRNARLPAARLRSRLFGSRDGAGDCAAVFPVRRFPPATRVDVIMEHDARRPVRFPGPGTNVIENQNRGIAGEFD